MTCVLKFLTLLFEQGLKYSAINTARSALSAVIQTDSDRTVGAHPLVVRFMKGVFELRTPMPRYSSTWDVSIVLKFIRELGANSDLSLKFLSWKLCTLLLLVSAQRVQTVHLMRLSAVEISVSGCKIAMLDKLKQTRPGFHQKDLEFSRYTEDEHLCVVNCLEEYVKRTAELRDNDDDKLLLCYQSPHRPASKDTISRWLKTVLIRAGIKDFAPHSFRGASSSAMLKSGVPLDDILKVAGWSKATTFRKFYNKPVQSNIKGAQANTILKYYAVQKTG